MELPELRNPESVRDLLTDLGDVYTSNVKRARDIIWTNLLREKCIEREDKEHWRFDFANYCYNLRHKGFYDDTNSLEDAVTELEDHETCDGLMKLLTLLAGSFPHCTPRTGLIPSIQEPLPHHILPDPDNRYYGDTHALGYQGFGRFLYRDQLFQSVTGYPEIEDKKKELSGFPSITALSRFIRPPNTKPPPPAITMSGEPAPPLKLPSPCEIFPSRDRGYPGHVTSDRAYPGHVTPILVDLPALPAPNAASIFKSLSQKKDTPHTTTGPVLKVSVKQRFAAALPAPVLRSAPVRCNAISPVSDSSGVESDNELWEQAFEDMDKDFPEPTYENVGRKVLQERPYLSESGHVTYTRLCVLLCSPYSDLNMVTEAHVLYQCQYVLLGMPTTIFQLDKVKVEFIPLQNICYTGVSPDSLVDSLYSIAYSGTLYLRLKMFCEQYSVVERYGNVAKALVSAVEQYLVMYQAFLNQLWTTVSSLIDLIWKTKDLTSQLEFLCNLLLLEEGLPVGTALLDYLHETAEMLTFSPFCKLMLTLVRAALRPYVKFLELWLCEGRVWDDWCEFHIAAHQEWLNNKDYLYWQYGYTEREGVQLPRFLSGLGEQLVNTGKLINLLRLCVPDHPLSVSKFRPPEMPITFGNENIAQNMKKWEKYRDSVESELKKQAAEREMKLKVEEEEKIQKLVAAKEDSKRRIALIMEEAGELRSVVQSNKRQELIRLQEQMLERAEERAAMLEKERREDKDRIVRNQTEQYELVAKVRSQLEEYYSSLTREKAKEERRSLWRIQRMKLNRLRRAHFMVEMNNLNRELRENMEKAKSAYTLVTGSVDGETTNVVRLDNLDLRQRTSVSSNVGVSTSSRKTWEQSTDIKIEDDVAKDMHVHVHNVHVTNEKIASSLESSSEKDVNTDVVDKDEQSGDTDEVFEDDTPKTNKSGNKITSDITGSLARLTKDAPPGVASVVMSGINPAEKATDIPAAEENAVKDTLSNETSDEVEQEDEVAPKVTAAVDATSLITQEVTTERYCSEDIAAKVDFVEEAMADKTSAGEEKTSAGEEKTRDFSSDNQGATGINPKDIDVDVGSEDDSEISFTLNIGVDTPEAKSAMEQLPKKSGSISDCENKKLKPDDQMKDILYNLSSPENDTQSSENPEIVDSEMKKLLSSADYDSSEPHIEKPFEPQGQVKELIYPENCDIENKEAVVSSEKQFEPLGQMKDLLYSSNSDNKSHTVLYNEPAGQMKDLLYSNSSIENKPHTALYNEPAGQMKDLLYSNSIENKPHNVLYNEPAGQMKDLLYSNSIDNKPHNILYNEPAGQMKDLLYGGNDSGVNETKTSGDITQAVAINSDEKEDQSYLDVAMNESDESFGDSGILSVDEQVEYMKVAFPEVNPKPNPNIMTDRLTRYYVPNKITEESDVERHRSLEVTLQRLILQPFLLQTHMVNAAAVMYFFDELKINQHFDALRSYLCMNDGMFGDTLSKGLFKMIDSGTDITSAPAKLNAVLHEAMECSKINNRLSLECVGNQVSEDVLDCLVLRYDIDWPSNIIINDNTLFKYNEIFKFLLKLKHGCYMLDKIWFLLGSVDKRGDSPQMRRLQTCRFEVAQFLHAVQIYMTHQLHNISWHELQSELTGVDSVSLLQQVHESYINNAMERLLLGESTKAPHQIILKIFKHVTVFLRLLERGPFSEDVRGYSTHPHFDKLIQRHEDFKKQAIFVLKVAESSNNSGYKPYIDEFTLRLDFNNYYRSSTIPSRKSALGLNTRGVNINNKGGKSLINSLSSPANNNLVSKSLVNSLSSPANNSLVSKSMNF